MSRPARTTSRFRVREQLALAFLFSALCGVLAGQPAHGASTCDGVPPGSASAGAAPGDLLGRHGPCGPLLHGDWLTPGPAERTEDDPSSSWGDEPLPVLAAAAFRGPAVRDAAPLASTPATAGGTGTAGPLLRIAPKTSPPARRRG